MAWIVGAGLTPYGRQPGRDALGWQAAAARAALDDAGLAPHAVDTVLAGYATTSGHLMPANLLAEHLGLRPHIASGMSAGGATGLAMARHAAALVSAGAARTVLVVAGEDRASGQSTDTSIRTLSQVGHHTHEVPLGANVPAYYALLASAYLHGHGLEPEALAPLAVQMRAHAARHPGAQYRDLISVADVLGSRPVAEPLRLLDCCPVSDGGAAFVVAAEPGDRRGVRIAGSGSANRHQHLSEADLSDLGAGRSVRQALEDAGVGLDAIEIAGIYDSFTVTLAMLLEEIGFAAPGTSGRLAAEGHFAADGELPLNTHGGLLSYGHSGVAGGMAHLAEVVTQLRGEAGDRQVPRQPRTALLHADGGVMSAHVSLVLEGSLERALTQAASTPVSAASAPVTEASTPATSVPERGSAVGTPLIGVCAACGHRWYLPRPFCPRCGSEDTESRPAEGGATLAAVTVVHRSATGERGPFGIALADLDEGVRLMARCDPDCRPGLRGRIRMRADPAVHAPDGRAEASAGGDPAADMIPFFTPEAP